MIRKKIKLVIVSTIIIYGIKSSFYKYFRNPINDPLNTYLNRVFYVKKIWYDKRKYYDIHPYRVYIMDFPLILKHYFSNIINADIILTAGYGAVIEPLISLVVGIIRKIPVFIKDTHWYWRNTILSRLFWYLYFYMLKKMTGILVPGRAAYIFWKKYGFRNVHIVHYYWLESMMTECKDIPPMLKKLRSNYDLIILYLGRLIRKRGLDILIKAYYKFLKEYNGKSILIIAGTGQYRRELEKLVIKLGLTENVLFTGPVSEDAKPCFYKIADIFVYPPILDQIPEEWPIPPLEAMSIGVPTIVSNIVGSIPDIYPGVYVVKWGSVEELTKALKKLADPDERNRVSMKAKVIHSSINAKIVYKELLLAILNSLKGLYGKES